jgi:hypothetical protein
MSPSRSPNTFPHPLPNPPQLRSTTELSRVDDVLVSIPQAFRNKLRRWRVRVGDGVGVGSGTVRIAVLMLRIEEKAARSSNNRGSRRRVIRVRIGE